MKNFDSKKITNNSPKKNIIIKGAKVNNLKNIDLVIPREKLVIITGLSGSGKSSLAFDTLFAEGHRMYIESLSSYARQFLGKIEKPDVEYIKGLSPAIAIEQKTNTRNPRSTVGTTTELYDYLKILFSRIGETISPISGNKVTKHTIEDVLEYINKWNEGTKIFISFSIPNDKINQTRKILELELSKGFTRVIVNNKIINIEEILNDFSIIKANQEIKVLVDRLIVKKDDEDNNTRISDSTQIAFFEGQGSCIIQVDDIENKTFTDKFELDGILFENLTTNFFNFNNPYGACTKCEGLGHTSGIDENKVIPNNKLSLYEGAILPWQSPTMKKWVEPLIKNHQKYNFPIHLPYNQLNENQKEFIRIGYKEFKGLNNFFKFLEKQSDKIQYRILLSKYKGKTTCTNCKGTRIRKDTHFVKISGKSIIDLLTMTISDLDNFFITIKLNKFQEEVSKRILEEILSRINYIKNVGLDYLTLHRASSTLSGGEYQRINLATSLGSTLVGTMYILDEPTVGLHPRDTQKLTKVLIDLKNSGNTVIVVEHEEEIMKVADQLIDIGPDAGTHGGEVVFQGNWQDLKKFNNSHTARYLNKKEIIPLPKIRRKWFNSFTINGARENNLKDINVEIPLGVLTVITGVSGSGKSTLVKKIIYPAIGDLLYMSIPEKGKYDNIEGDHEIIQQLEFVDQNPLMKSSRSNPVTYIKAYDLIRNVFSKQPLSKQKNYTPSTFSFNIDGGRCEGCNGEGVTKIEMQFMADITLQCELCNGKRFKDEVLEVKLKNKNISQVLDMTVDESVIFFQEFHDIIEKIKPLQDVGLGYICLGQSSNSLSGGEAQRIKLATYLKNNSPDNRHKLFIFDEPTTGLHFHDINKLLTSINKLVDQGNSVLIIEHNLDVIKNADWIIDMGPEEGEKGGEITFAGTPEEMTKLKNNETAKYLKEKMDEH